VDTFRPSGDSPNLLNIFKREEFAKNIIRSSLIPRDGHRIIEYDYKALEVAIGACYHRDPTMIKYLTSSDADMHRYFTEKTFKIKWDDLVKLQGSEEAAKAVRQDVKGDFVFAEQYGSFWKQVAVDLWEDAKKHNLIDYLKSQGIKTYKDFEKHIEEVETDMWDNQFPVYKEWRIKQYKDYQKKGYVDLLTGFRAYGPMSRNNSFNTPVQGAAYHILQWYFNQVRKVLENPKKFRNTYQITQIYDAHVNDVDPSEEDMLDYVVWYWGTQKVMEQFPWITVPLVIEKERSEINGNWGEMSECGIVKGD
jgi:DNA polymerase I-like protein with 3'-5' exonuclease and polymerase domains